jgi:parallel beta-helix repeat protein
MLSASTAQAAVLNVPGTYATIQSAIDAADAGDTVQVAAGVYFGNISLKNGVTVQGSGAGTCTIKGNGTSSVVFANRITQPAAIYGFTITGGMGYVVPWSENRIMGGGIFADRSVLTIGNNRIYANKAQMGGGIALLNSQFDITGNSIISNSAVSGNATATNMGGGIYLYDSKGRMDQNTISNNRVSSGVLNPTLVSSGGNMAPGGGICIVFSRTVGEIIIHQNLISTNTATGSQFYGGGIYCYQSSKTLTNGIRITGNDITGNQGLDGGGIAIIQCSPTISDNVISGNSGHWGGGLYGFSGGGTILNNTFDKNHADTIRPGMKTGGGGVLCDEGYSPTIRGNTFSSNTAVDYGGGLEVYLAAAVVQENVFTGNSAQFGGGITVQDAGGKIERNYIKGNWATTGSGGGLFISNTPHFSLKNNLIVDNSAAGYGGGISIFNNGMPELYNNTVVGNTAGIWGGGIHGYGSAFTVMNNIIANNSEYGIFVENSTISDVYNDISGNGEGEYYGVTAGIGSIFLSPQFSDTNTYRSAAGSPSVDAGNPDAAFSDPDGSRNDMGAYGGPLAGYIPAPGNPLSPPVLTLVVEGNQLTASWTGSSLADGYTLYYASPDVSHFGSIDMGTKTGISAGLGSGSCFHIGVKAYGGTGDSGHSNIENFCIP